ncbi:sulfite exporter TauE/SafE family protein [Planctomycetes bacterium K23_9]|uniref:Probable membrane transporter protein n=1 Tax=Stieleria marina TaxID=1930275 RepID=A0A517NRW7_9BACT|nr:Sulfite exporter TauE/SafE [Planctomycetes bacterium K23_9]
MQDYLPLAMILFVGIFVQSSAGFAAGLIIVPSLLWFGFSIPEAQASLLIATVPQNIAGVWTLRESISIRRIALPAFTRLVFLPIGVCLLVSLQTFPIDRIKQVVGLVVLIATLAIILFKPTPRQSLHPAWAWLAFPLSGLLQGLVGMGGPAMVFWVQAHDWTPRQMRGFLFAMYLISLAPGMIVLYLFFGDLIVRPAVFAALAIPLLLLATYLGLKFGDWLGRQRLRKVTLGLLLIIGIAGIASPYLPMHQPSAETPSEAIAVPDQGVLSTSES